MGLRGPLSYVHLWSRLWDQWRAYGSSVAVQWVPSHVGVQGNKRADEGAVWGLARSFATLVKDREVRDIWADLGLEEMDDPSNDNMSWGSQCIARSTDEGVTDNSTDDDVSDVDNSSGAASLMEPRSELIVTTFRGRGSRARNSEGTCVPCTRSVRRPHIRMRPLDACARREGVGCHGHRPPGTLTHTRIAPPPPPACISYALV